ncbi:MAG TPA: diaminopimelate dehydrogenase [Actinomycetaceae bacterium]|nr:diaminopimelate dehydrogenase [Actinomycetaceae bacterium]
MAQPIRIGIAGWGNLGRGAARALAQQPDMTLAGVYSRRPAEQLPAPLPDAPVLPWEALTSDDGDTARPDIDVLLLCGGSKTDLPEHGPLLAERFTTVDSYDTHARIPDYFAAVDGAARRGGRTAIISVGWDPGLFSLTRVLSEAVLPQGESYTFWGKGLSQGHSDAVRRVPGVANGVQYTLPAPDAIEAVRAGRRPQLTTRQKHRRECYVVLSPGADAEEVEQAIVTMPDYFADFDTSVHFITAEELERDHSAMPHGGFVMRSATTGEDTDQLIEYRLELGSNPEFTASVLVAYARAAHRMQQSGDHGAKTIFDVPIGLVSPLSAADLRAGYL